MVPGTTGSVRARSAGSSRNLVCGPTLSVPASIDAIERPFTPDGTKDLGSGCRRRGVDQITPYTRRPAKQNAFAFFHIPLYASFFLVDMCHQHLESRFFSQESYFKVDIDPPTGRPLDVGTRDLEGKGSAKGNRGFFEKGLMTAIESDRFARGIYREVKAVANGQSHRTPVSHFTICVDPNRTFVSVTENCRRQCQGHLHVFRRWRVRFVSGGLELLKS
jgi:hypothetical protein